MLLALSMQHGMTKQAFIQAPLEQPLYMSLPPGLTDLDHYEGKVLKATQLLYGHCFSAKLFYELLVERLGTIGFRASEYDSCLFLGNGCIIVLMMQSLLPRTMLWPIKYSTKSKGPDLT